MKTCPSRPLIGQHSAVLAKTLYTFVLVTLAVCARAQGAAPSSDSAASSAAPPGTATASVTPPSGERRTFDPKYLPTQVEFTKEELDAIRAAASRQMIAYHHSLEEANRAAAAKHDLWLQNHRNSYENDRWNREHTQKVLLTHANLSVIIFWVVIVIVAVALGLTVYQFTRDSANVDAVIRRLLRGRRAASAAEGAPADFDPAALTALLNTLRAENKLTLNLGGVVLGSQFVGLVLLSFAMGFFYLYLEKVYPVTIADPVLAHAAAAASAAGAGR